jgi:transposase
MLDGDTGEVVERTLTHEGEAVREFYASIPRPAVVGIEATGSMAWFLQLLEELAIPCRVGHPAAVRKAETRRQKHDRRDADLLLKLLVEDRFPAIWMPSTEQRDLRALLLHRHQWVRMRTRVQQALQAMAMSHGLRSGATLWSRNGQATLAAMPLPPHAAHRRSELLALYQHLAAQVDQLDARVEKAVRPRSAATRLMTHPGVGPVTALATEVFLGDPGRFADGKALASYVGMIPSCAKTRLRPDFSKITEYDVPPEHLLDSRPRHATVGTDAHLSQASAHGSAAAAARLFPPALFRLDQSTAAGRR